MSTYKKCMGNLSFFNADNLEIMRCFKDKEFDLAIVDPPYLTDNFLYLLSSLTETTPGNPTCPASAF